MTSAIRVGIYLDLRNPPQWRRDWSALYEQTLEWTEAAEALGLDAVWASEHHLFEDGYLSQPFVLLAAIAARTARIRIGTALLVAPFRHPVHIAEQAALVDVLSGGRLELGLGSGYRPAEFDAFGVPFEERGRMLEDAVAAVRELWSQGTLQPQPIQEQLPIWLGAASDRGARRAGRLGTRLLAIDAQLLRPYVEGLRSAGIPESRAAMGGLVSMTLSEDPERDWPLLRDHLAYQWDTYRRYGAEGTGRPAPAPVSPERLRLPGPGGEAPRGEVVTPEEAAERLEKRLSGLPVSDIYFWLSIAGMPDDLVEAHLNLLATRLAPRLRGENPKPTEEAVAMTESDSTRV